MIQHVKRIFKFGVPAASIAGFEVSAAWARERKSKLNAKSVQAKWVITTPDENGCNIGIVGGSTNLSGGGGRTNYAKKRYTVWA